MVANVFVSYANSDRNLAQAFIEVLVERGVLTSTAEELPRGRRWAEALRSKLAQSDAAVFIASAASLKSPQVMTELGAFEQTRKPIVAIQPPGTEPPSPRSPFSLVQTIDAGRLSPGEIADQIVARLEHAS